MMSKPLRLALGGIAATILTVVFLLLGPWSREHRLIRQARPVQAALENYRQQHGNYPESLEAARIPQPDEIFYQRSEDGYQLWFGLELGESMTFCSDTGTWK